MAKENKAQGYPPQFRHALDELLAERKQLLIVFCQAAGANEGEHDKAYTQLLKRLCQLLMDYAALWQFEIHDALLLSEKEHPVAVAVLKQHQPVIQQAANIALDFNDMFDIAVMTAGNPDMESQLSDLGESLASRFEAEDLVVLNL